MRELLTPKQIARALDVSESSIKRWCDQGAIPAQYTAGGHRRVTRAALVEFLRTSKHQLVHPEALGLPATSGQTVRVIDRARDGLVEALLRGDELRCRQITIDLYLSEHSVSVICDDVYAAAFREIGSQWECGSADVYQERRGCEISLRLLTELRSLLAAPADGAPLAIGGASSGDQYSLGTCMAELVLRDGGWRAVSLGDNIPLESFAAAIREHRPKLFWLSCSFIEDETDFLDGYQQLYDEFGLDVAFVVGGFALDETIRQGMKYSAHCDNMQHLDGFAQTLRAAIENKPAE